MDLNRDNIKKIRGLIVFTAIIIVAVWNYEVVLELIGFIGNIITPFLIGGSLAFVLNVPMNFFERHLFLKKDGTKRKGGRLLSFLITLIVVMGVIAVVLFVVIPQLGTTIGSLNSTVQRFIWDVQQYAMDVFQNNEDILDWISDFEFDWDKMIQSGVDFLRNGAGSVLNSTFAAAKSIVNGVTTFFISFVFACYILLQKEKLEVQAKKVCFAFLPKQKAEQMLAVCSLTYQTFSHFLTGQCLEAVILGTMFFVVMTVFRFPYALLVGILIAFTALIPIFGAFIGCAVGAFLILMVNPMQAIAFVVMFLILQQIEGNLIYPHVVGGSIGLPSMWVLVAVTLGGSLMGIVGMLIFIPAASVIYTLLRGLVYKRLNEKKIKL